MTRLSPQTIRDAIDRKTKPLGSLGRLEALAAQLATVQNTLKPSIERPAMLVFAGDHGIVAEGVSAYPQEVTWQMVLNYLQGGAAINVFARLHQLDLWVIDAGVNHDFSDTPGLISRKVGHGTANFRHEPAMSTEGVELCLARGRALVRERAEEGCNLVCFGEMGIGNTSSAAVLMHLFCDLPIEQCTGKGAGLDNAGLAYKTQVLRAAVEAHGRPDNPLERLCYFGGFELAMMCGAMLEAQAQGMLLVIDGFIVTAAFLVAHALDPRLREHAIFSHCSEEHGHGAMLAYLGAEPLLSLGLRLGEGTGAALALPLIRSAAAFMCEMATFGEAGVSQSHE